MIFAIISRSFHAVVASSVIRTPVAIILSVGLIVLVLIGNEIIERKAIMRGNEIDARPRPAAAMIEKIGRARQTRREIGELAFFAFPIPSHRIAEAVVPLGPAGRKCADLVAPWPAVPWFGDELDGRQHRILTA